MDGWIYGGWNGWLTDWFNNGWIEGDSRDCDEEGNTNKTICLDKTSLIREAWEGRAHHNTIRIHNLLFKSEINELPLHCAFVL